MKTLCTKKNFVPIVVVESSVSSSFPGPLAPLVNDGFSVEFEFEIGDISNFSESGEIFLIG